jgi:hypothetical protein
MKLPHPIYIYSAQNKILKVHNDSHKDKNVDIIDNMMLIIE